MLGPLRFEVCIKCVGTAIKLVKPLVKEGSVLPVPISTDSRAKFKTTTTGGTMAHRTVRPGRVPDVSLLNRVSFEGLWGKTF
jgi:hypothetical protein